MWRRHNPIETEERQGEKLTANNIQMIEGATTIMQEKSRTMNQVSQARDTMAITTMEETTTIHTIATVTQVKIVCTTGEEHLLQGVMMMDLLPATTMMMMIDLPAATTAMKKNSMANSSTICPSSMAVMTPRTISSGLSRWTRSFVSTTIPKPRKWPWHLLSLRSMLMCGGNKLSKGEKKI